MHQLTGHHWFKVQAKLKVLRSSDQKTTQKQPKVTVSIGEKTFENLKLKNYRYVLLKLVHYVYHFNPFHLLKTEGVNQRDSTSEKTIQKCQEFIKILTLI